MRLSRITRLFGGLAIASALSATSIYQPTNAWRIGQLTNQSNIIDTYDDQQTGDHTADIVGNYDWSTGTGHPGFYLGFDAGSITNHLDGSLMFRVRFGDFATDKGVDVFKSVVAVGVDGNADGRIDIFLIADEKPNQNKIRIHLAGSGNCNPCNTGPSNTTIDNSASGTLNTYTQNGTNYQFMQVDDIIDVTANGAWDLDADGKRDHFLSYAVPFNDVANALNALNLTKAGSPISFTDQTPLRFLLATSQQGNALNQDIGGCNGTPTNWEACGLTIEYRPFDLQTPEPGTNALVGLTLAGAGWFLYRRRQLPSAVRSEERIHR